MTSVTISMRHCNRAQFHRSWPISLQDDSATEAPQTEDEEPLVYEGEDEEDTFYSPEARSKNDCLFSL